MLDVTCAEVFLNQGTRPKWHVIAVLAVFMLLSGGPVSSAFAAGAKPPSQINVNPRSLNFGTHKRGTITKLNFAIANLSKTDILRISIFLPNVPPFAVIKGGGATALAPRGRMQVTVQFSPPFPGSYTQQVNVNSNDAVNPSIPITLRGVAK